MMVGYELGYENAITFKKYDKIIKLGPFLCYI